jgi:hypothetical protein
MLPKSFQQQNILKKSKLISQMKLYVITYDYELCKYYAEHIKESYDKWGNIVDNLGIMKLIGYDIKEIKSNFNQLMKINYIDTHKINNYDIININEELFIDKSIL